MLYRVMTTCLKDVVESHHVAHDISIRIGDAISYPRLCGKVHHHLRLVLFEDVVDSGTVGYIALDELVLAMRFLCFVRNNRETMLF